MISDPRDLLILRLNLTGGNFVGVVQTFDANIAIVVCIIF